MKFWDRYYLEIAISTSFVGAVTFATVTLHFNI